MAILHCAKCEGSGVEIVSNGPDDCDVEFCSCPIGQTKQFDKTWSVGGWEKLPVVTAA